MARRLSAATDETVRFESAVIRQRMEQAIQMLDRGQTRGLWTFLWDALHSTTAGAELFYDLDDARRLREQVGVLREIVETVAARLAVMADGERGSRAEVRRLADELRAALVPLLP